MVGLWKFIYVLALFVPYEEAPEVRTLKRERFPLTLILKVSIHIPGSMTLCLKDIHMHTYSEAICFQAGQKGSSKLIEWVQKDTSPNREPH